MPSERKSNEAVQAVEAWKHSDFLCHNYVLNGLVDDLYNMYCKTMTAKELWEYNASIKLKTLILIHEIHVEGMTVSETFQVAAIIEKLPPSWKVKGKVEYLALKARIIKQKFQRTYYNCDQPGHCAVNCKMPKRVNPRQANIVNDNMDMIAMVSYVISMIYEVNLVGSKNSSWWVDTGATRHVCADKSMFHSFRAVDTGEKLYIGNSTTVDIKGEGDVILKMTSEKELKLTNVLYVFEIRKNLMIFCECKDESIDKFVLYKTKVENQLGRKIKVVQSDRGGEYVSPFPNLCAKHGIRHEFTTPYSPQQNGISERKNRTLKEMVNAMLISSDKRQQDDNDLQDERQDQPEENKVEPRRSKRARTEKSFRADFVSFIIENEPNSYQEVINSLEGPRWKEAIKSEIDSILQNHTWELIDLPSRYKLLGYKWIFKKKITADGTINKYKARLVIKGFRQHEGLDYLDTYSPVM
ncbi:retrotransposon protein, putative, ty1-copia subclass [Tanacetum coccineum]